MTAPQMLYLAHRIPYPPDKGDKIRSWNTLEHLAKRFRVHLAAFVDDPADFQHEAFLNGICESATLIPLDRRSAAIRSARGFLSGEALTLNYYRDRRMANAVARARTHGLAAEIAYSSAMAQYIEGRSNAPRLVDFCDADSAKWLDYAQRRSWPMSALYAREGARLADAESAIINWSDAAFAISEEEADLLGSREDAEKAVAWYCNGVDANYFAPDRIDAVEPHTTVFVGAMNYWPNVDAVTWFHREIWPLVRAAKNDATFAIVGSNPTKDVRALDGRDGIRVTGRVADVRPFVAGAKVVIAPMRIARGVQNKVLEAMAMGKAIVSTPAGLEGIDARIGVEAIVAAAAPAFADEVVQLANDKGKADRIGAAARARILSDYLWPHQLARLDATLDALIA